MDAYDIFKKLSRGAKFKRKEFENHTENKNKRIKLENDFTNRTNTEAIVKIKLEPIDEYNENEIIKYENDTEDRELTLLDTITANETGKKKKRNKNKVFDEDKLLEIEQEKINEYRNKNRIKVIGNEIPAPLTDFNQLQIGSDLIENLFKCGYTTPTLIQQQAIPVMLEQRPILACAPTGSGKTAAFLVPILHHLREPQKKGFRALILCPTRELAKQTQRECVRLGDGRGFRIHIISKIKHGLANYGPKSSQKFDILVATPNRICFLLKQDPPVLSLANIEWLVIDEADKLFEEGVRGFRDQLKQIMNACTSTNLKISMFSATRTDAVTKWCRQNVPGIITVGVGQQNAATDLVDQKLLFVGSESGKLVAFRNLIRKGLAPPILVFVQSKERAQQLFAELIYDGINVDAIHSERTQTQRDNTVRCFREGKIWVLICTELMARGIDFKGVNLVINYDFPPSGISYVHRIGRAGRAGRRGEAVTFFTTNDTPNLRSIAYILRQSGCEVPDYMLKIKKQPKNDRNKVLKRDDITTRPKYAQEKYEKRRFQYVKPLPNVKEALVDNEKQKKAFKKKKPFKKIEMKQAASKARLRKQTKSTTSKK